MSGLGDPERAIEWGIKVTADRLSGLVFGTETRPQAAARITAERNARFLQDTSHLRTPGARMEYTPHGVLIEHLSDGGARMFNPRSNILTAIGAPGSPPAAFAPEDADRLRQMVPIAERIYDRPLTNGSTPSAP